MTSRSAFATAKRHSPLAKKLKLALPAVLVALALIAAACGSDDDDEGTPDTTAAATPTTQADAQEPAGTEPAGTDETGTEPEETSPPPPTEPPPVTAPAETSDPTYGGTLTVGLEAETAQGWNPASTTCAVSCHIVMSAIFDPLVLADSTGEVVPYLLESMTPNDDFTSWEMKLREGISFHDGTPADSAALKRHLAENVGGLLTGIIMRPLLGNPQETIEIVDDLTVQVNLTVPNAGFPSVLTGQIGYLAAPSQYDLGADSAANPIGTGPFMFESWTLDTNLTVVRNDSYWRADEQGNQLPYLERIVFRPIPDSNSRHNTLRSGQLNVNNDNSPLRFPEYSDEFNVLAESEAFRETVYVLINNEQAPFDSLEARRAVAMCTNQEVYNQLRAGGNTPSANGPLSPGTPGYLEDTGYPSYDTDTGSELWDSLEDPGTIRFTTTNDPFNLDSTNVLAEMWGDCGIDVEIDQVDQSALISNAIAGNFQLMLWRNHTGVDLEIERVWWHSDNAQGLAVNFGRIRNDNIDQALTDARSTDDPAENRALAEAVNREFGSQVHNIWLTWSLWQMVYDNSVKNIGVLDIPGGGTALPLYAGRTYFTQTWRE